MIIRITTTIGPDFIINVILYMLWQGDNPTRKNIIKTARSTLALYGFTWTAPEDAYEYIDNATAIMAKLFPEY